MKNDKGYVYLVGSGPGDLDLITVKGLRLIEEADVLIYDYLANSLLIDKAKSGAEKIYVGKQSNKHTLSQDGINKLLVDKACKGNNVVRLKGGDPFIFGRGGEEAEYVVSKGIPFEVVPGVTSAISVPAYAGIPLTHRDHTTSVAFITGHERPDKEQSAIPWEELAKGPGTLVFLMGVKNLPEIAKILIEFGRNPKCPVAVIQWGSTNKQRTVIADLATISDEAKRCGITPPAIIVIGDVVRLREQLNWFEKRPLFGKTIINTRSRAQASQLTFALSAYGANVIEFPTIEIKPILDNTLINEAIKNIDHYDWLVLTSVNGVKIFFEHLYKYGKDSRCLHNLKVAAIGPATSKELKGWGICADFIPEKYQAEDIVAGFLDMGIKNKRVLLPRAKVARDYLPNALSSEGVEVNVVPIYETCMDESANLQNIKELLKNNSIDTITFTSSSTVKNFFNRISEDELFKKTKPHFACIGPITEDELSKHGYKAEIMPKQYTIEHLALSILNFYKGEL